MICLTDELWQITDLLATDKYQYLPQPCTLIVNYVGLEALFHTRDVVVP